MLTFTTLASGSSGNAALVSCGRTHILLDAGISARRITTALKALGVPPQELSAFQRQGFALVEWGGAEVTD